MGFLKIATKRLRDADAPETVPAKRPRPEPTPLGMLSRLPNEILQDRILVDVMDDSRSIAAFAQVSHAGSRAAFDAATAVLRHRLENNFAQARRTTGLNGTQHVVDAPIFSYEQELYARWHVNSHLVGPIIQRGRQHLEREEFPQAQSVFERCLEMRPQALFAQLGLADTYLGLRENQKAQDLFRTILQHRPNFVEALMGLAKALPSGPAAGVYRNVTELDSTNIDAHSCLGKIYFDLSQYADSARSYGRVIELDDTISNVHLGLGMALEKQDLLTDALQSFKHAAELDQTNADAHYSAGRIESRLRHLQSASESFARARNLGDFRLIEHFDLQTAFINLKDHAATEQLGHIMMKHTTNHLVRMRLASAQLAQQKYAEALNTAKIERCDEEVVIMMQLIIGHCLHNMRNYEAAIESYEQALKVDKENKLAQQHLAKSRQALKDKSTFCDTSTL